MTNRSICLTWPTSRPCASSASRSTKWCTSSKCQTRLQTKWGGAVNPDNATWSTRTRQSRSQSPGCTLACAVSKSSSKRKNQSIKLRTWPCDRSTWSRTTFSRLPTMWRTTCSLVSKVCLWPRKSSLSNPSTYASRRSSPSSSRQVSTWSKLFSRCKMYYGHY